SHDGRMEAVRLAAQLELLLGGADIRPPGLRTRVLVEVRPAFEGRRPKSGSDGAAVATAAGELLLVTVHCVLDRFAAVQVVERLRLLQDRHVAGEPGDRVKRPLLQRGALQDLRLSGRLNACSNDVEIFFVVNELMVES